MTIGFCRISYEQIARVVCSYTAQTFVRIWQTMNQRIEIETGAQLLARLTDRPALEGLENILFSDGPRRHEVIELSGDSSSGKTLLTIRLIAKCILPLKYKGIKLNGLGAGVVFVNTDHHFHISTLVNSMAHLIHGEKSSAKRDSKVLSNDVVRRIIEDSLRYLTVVNCYASSQYLLGLQSLQTILSNDDKIALIAVDSMSTYYWQDRDNGGTWSMDEYLNNFLKLVRKHTFHHKVVLVYTRPSDFGSKGKRVINVASAADEERIINYKIQLFRCEEINEFSAIVESMTGQRKIGYTISENGIEWKTIKSKN